MKQKGQIIQLSLIFIGLILIFSTYFLYPKIKKNKFEKLFAENEQTQTDEEKINRFENVEYKGFYNINEPFTVNSEKAYVLKTDPDIIHMSNMMVKLYLDDGRIVTITSKDGRYNKVTYDCFFENDVVSTDGESKISAKNLDLLASKNFVKIYNNVVLVNDSGTLIADQVYYDFEKKFYQISMFEDEKVKIKLIEWVILKNLGL